MVRYDAEYGAMETAGYVPHPLSRWDDLMTISEGGPILEPVRSRQESRQTLVDTISSVEVRESDVPRLGTGDVACHLHRTTKFTSTLSLTLAVRTVPYQTPNVVMESRRTSSRYSVLVRREIDAVMTPRLGETQRSRKQASKT